MSRSYKKPYHRVCCIDDTTPGKLRAQEHRAERAALRSAIHNALFSPDPEDADIGEVFIPDLWLIGDGKVSRPSTNPRASRK